MTGLSAVTAQLPGALQGPVGRALIELATPESPLDFRQVEFVVEQRLLASLSRHVFEHRLDAPFVHSMSQLGLVAPEGHLTRIAEDRVARMRATAALVAIGAVLDKAEIDWAIIKGPMSARHLHHPEHRACNDLDVLVSARQFGPAITELIGAGAEELNHNWNGYLKYQVGEVPLRYGGIPIDLHWSLVGLGRWRRTMKFDSSAMLRRRVYVDLGDGIEAPGLDTVDALVHLCVHAAMSGAGRLDQLRDIASAVGDASGLDWDELCARSRAALVGSLVAHALDRSAIILGAAVPETVRRELGGRSLVTRRWIDSRGSPNHVSLRGLPVISARDTLASRWRARAVLVRERFKGKISPNYSWDFANPDSVLYQGTVDGGAKTRDAFINAAR